MERGRIIWINGAFGSGKTSVAHELQRRSRRAWIFDPEEAGYFLRRCQPKTLWLDNFQDEPLWRTINYEMLLDLTARYDGVIICPMTLSNPLFYTELIGRLRQEGVRVDHFLLSAQRETLLTRLRSRGDGKGSWAAKRIDQCLACFEDPVFENRIKTDHLTIGQIAAAISIASGLKLSPENPGRARSWLRRRMTTVRAIRLPFKK